MSQPSRYRRTRPSWTSAAAVCVALAGSFIVVGHDWEPTLLAEAALQDNAEPAAAVRIEWSSKDIAGKDVKVPAADRPTVVLFAQADQAQSQDAMTQAKAVLGAEAGAQVILVLTGAQAEAAAARIAKDAAWAWPIVIDRDYAASGQMSVHVWPTTLVISSGGELLAHLAGLSQSYSKQLRIYLAFATGKIGKAELERQLTAERVVVDTPEQMAARHLQVAERLLAKGLIQQARAELAKGLQLQPGHPGLQLAMVRVLLLGGEPEQALAALDKLDVSTVPPWRVELLRGRVLIALGKWDQARVVLNGATRLNPQPGEAYYALGLVYQHAGDWQRAAEAYRQAFESTAVGREALITSAASQHAPATQPAD